MESTARAALKDYVLGFVTEATATVSSRAQAAGFRAQDLVLCAGTAAVVVLWACSRKQESEQEPEQGSPSSPKTVPSPSAKKGVTFQEEVEVDVSSTDDESADEQPQEVSKPSKDGSEPSGPSPRRPVRLNLMSLEGPATYSPPRFADALKAANTPSKGTMVKFVTFVRHGQAAHNVNAEVMRAKGCTFKEFLNQMMKDDAFDAPLTEKGQQQAKVTVRAFGRTAVAQSIRLVVSSPLTRAIETADLTMPGPERRVILEEFRERAGMLKCGQRRKASELEALHPRWDVSRITEGDELWAEKMEEAGATCERGYQGLQWLWEQPEQHVAVVGHGGIFETLLTQHVHVLADDDMKQKFVNCETRTCRLSMAANDTPHPGGSNKPTFKLEWVRP